MQNLNYRNTTRLTQIRGASGVFTWASELAQSAGWRQPEVRPEVQRRQRICMGCFTPAVGTAYVRVWLLLM